ncbi:MAG: YgiT-type zinc finger protein [Thermodesulfobacteriota bacterium]|jgi:YgiT-type zinc finger domain-containing protein
METQGMGEIDPQAGKQPGETCGNCGSDATHPASVRSAFWHGDRLVVVEDIPAIVCGACHEQFYDDHTVVLLDLLRGDGFPSESALRELRVPVFSLRDRTVRREEP